MLFLACSVASGWPRLSASSPRQQGRPPVLAVNTQLVVLPVSVTDSRGQFVSGLTAGDFQIFEDGRSQKITFFEEQDTPVTLGLLVDHSGSMVSKLREVAAAVSSFAHSSNPQDEMFVVDFADTVSVELLDAKPFTSDPKELEQAVVTVSAAGQTALYDAVAEGFLHLQYGQWKKKALIIVSDGGDNASRHNLSQVLAMARQSQVVIYAIGLVDQSGLEENPGILERLCKETGGIAFFPRNSESIAEVSRKIAQDVREQYTLGYPPPQDASGAFHKIEVKVSVPGGRKVRVRTRAGYSMAPESVSPSGGSR